MGLKIKHIFQIPFTGKTPGIDGTGYSGDEWYEQRAEIFKKYTIQSLINQSVKNFFLWLTFRPEELKNPITKKIAKALKKSGIDNLMSFNGTMFTEDRAVWHNEDLEERLKKCLPDLRKKIGKADLICETNLDSDDLVHKKFSEIVQNTRNYEALYCKKGFVYQIFEDKLSDWNNPESNQNYTIFFDYKIYFNAKERLKYLRGLKSHEEVPKLFNSKEMPEGLYCSLIHGKNISTLWGHPFRGKEYYYEDEKNYILKDFGIKINNNL